MKKKELLIENKLGLHARAAAQIVKMRERIRVKDHACQGWSRG